MRYSLSAYHLARLALQDTALSMSPNHTAEASVAIVRPVRRVAEDDTSGV
jgi:hypothetical protein